MKDDKYKWESELRIVFENQHGIQNIPKIYNVPVNLNTMIDRIELHPASTDNDKRIIAKILKKKKLSHLIYW